MKKELNIAVQNLYNVFSIYHLDAKRLRASSCPCCVTEKEIREITTKPLTELSENELGHFSRSAISTFGTVEDYKHFLPRILELMQEPDSAIPSDFIIHEKLNYAELETWPMEEQRAIKNYFTSLWGTIIQSKSTPYYQIEDVLNLIMKYGNLTECLYEFVNFNVNGLIAFIVNGVLYGFSLKANIEQKKIIETWLYSEHILTEIDKAFFEAADSEFENSLSIVYSILEKKHEITFC